MALINCLGVAVVDALSGPLAQYPVPRVQPQVVTKSLRFAAGGGAVNTASALARMGLDAAVFTKVGDDVNGAFLLEELRRSGVATAGVRVAAGETTPFTFVGIHPDGDRTFVHTPGTNLSFGPKDMDTGALFNGRIFLYQDLWVLPGLDGEPGAVLLAEARRRGLITALDVCWGLGPDRDTLLCMLPQCDYVMPSMDEMRTVWPGASPEEVARNLHTAGAGTVILKMGRQGCLTYNGCTITVVPALSATVVDTTGAGDCWDAGFLAALVHGETPVDAVRIGHACAAFGIEAVGGSAGVPDYAQVHRRAATGNELKQTPALPRP